MEELLITTQQTNFKTSPFHITGYRVNTGFNSLKMYQMPMYPPAQGYYYQGSPPNYPQNPNQNQAAYTPDYPQPQYYLQPPPPTQPLISNAPSPPLDNPANKPYYTSGNVPVDPTCSNFPGLVPDSDKIDYSGSDTITVNLFPIKGATEILSQWLSTGFYAVPGMQIRMAVTTNIADAQENREYLRYCQLLIGCHIDNTSDFPDEIDQNNLLRPNVIFIKTEIISDYNGISGTAALANPFGGLIYLIIPTCGINSIQVTITLSGGRVRAPVFKLGQTSLKDWTDRIRHEPAPFGELQSDKIIISLPSSDLKKIEDPAPILRCWDEVWDLMYDLVGKAHERARPERFVTDIQLDTDWLHSGYPIMLYLEKIPDILDWERVQRDGDWGLFHEMGHQHQEGVWMFDGTLEVTVNLFTMYIFDVLLKIPFTKTEHAENFQPEEIKQQVQAYIKSSKDFIKVWEEEPFFALMMYYQLLLRYSWRAYTAVFSAYRSLDQRMLPNNRAHDDGVRENQEKIHLWVYMFSQVVKENLTEFFRSWNLPITNMRCGEMLLKINPNFPMCPMRMKDLLHFSGPGTGPGSGANQLQNLPAAAQNPYFYESNTQFVGRQRTKCCVIL